MADTPKITQTALAATTPADVYTVPASTTFIGFVTFANRSATATTYRLSVGIAGLATEDKQYLAYDIPIIGNSTSKKWWVMLNATDIIRAYAGAATVSVTVNGIQVT